MNKLVIIALLLAYLIVDTVLRLSDISFAHGKLKNNVDFDNKVTLPTKISAVEFRTDIFPTQSGGFNQAQGDTALLSSDTLSFDQTKIRLLAISLKANTLYATFKAEQENPVEGFGHYYHASKGEDVLGAKIIDISARAIELELKEQKYTLNLFNSGENNAVK